jgi:hypothetical protein
MRHMCFNPSVDEVLWLIMDLMDLCLGLRTSSAEAEEHNFQPHPW